MLHGAGDSADGLMQIAQCWAEAMPTVAFLMPSAPVRGRYSSWFARDQNAPTRVKPCCNYETITEQLLELLDSARRRLGLEYSQVCLWGYSAGALMASWLASLTSITVWRQVRITVSVKRNSKTCTFS